MHLRIVSDLHLLHHRDHGDSFQASFNPLSEDEVLVLAGDIIDSAAVGNRFRKRMERFASKWRRVVYVTGNHEYYGSEPFKVHRAINYALASLPNVTWLNNSSTIIDGVKFYGGTLWFRPDREGLEYERLLSDFSEISKFKPWVYDQHIAFKAGLSKIEKGSVVVSHHLPAHQSVHPKYRTGPWSNLNRFFVGDVEPIIVEREPSIWIHGHTHEAVDYKIGPTRILANPFGYPLESKYQFREELIVEVDEARTSAEAPNEVEGPEAAGS